MTEGLRPQGGPRPQGSGAPGAGPSQGTDPEQLAGTALQHAQLLAAQGRYDDALAALNPGLAASPGNPGLRQHRGWLLLTLWRLDEAREELTRLLGDHPEFHDAGRLLSITLQRQGDLLAAERAIETCLAAEPSEPLHHLQRARVFIDALPTRRDKRRLRKAARRYIDLALSFAEGNPGVYGEAALALWNLGKPREGLDVVKRGLAGAPEHPELRALHADLVVAASPGHTAQDSMQQDALHAVEMGKLLASDPQHREARTALFGSLWFRATIRDESLMYIVAVAALGIITGFRDDIADTKLLTSAWLVALIIGGVQWLRYLAIARSVPRGFLRSIAGSRPVDRVRQWGRNAVWLGLVGSGVAALFVRDAVAVRWLIVLLCVLVLVAFACAVLWQVGYLRRARTFEGAPTDRDTIVRLAAHRSQLAAVVVVRCLGALGLGAFSGIAYALAGFGSARGDVAAVFGLSASCMVLAPAVGWFLAWVAERNARESLSPAITVGVQAKPPALWSPVIGGVLAASCVLGMLGGIVGIPVAPNEYDTVGRYLVEPSVGGGAGDSNDSPEDECTGRPATRLACQQKRLKEMTDNAVPSVPQVDIPDIPSVSDYPDPNDFPDFG